MSDISPTEVWLTDEEHDAFRMLSAELAEYDDYVLAAQLQSAQLPERIRRAAAHFRRYGDPSGGLLLRNMPVEPLPPTPHHADYGRGIYLPAARVFSLAAALFGDQFGFQPELAGHIIQDILP